jgi:hypothetical protein
MHSSAPNVSFWNTTLAGHIRVHVSVHFAAFKRDDRPAAVRVRIQHTPNLAKINLAPIPRSKSTRRQRLTTSITAGKVRTRNEVRFVLAESLSGTVASKGELKDGRMETWWVTHESMSHPGADLPADLALAWLASLPPRRPTFRCLSWSGLARDSAKRGVVVSIAVHHSRHLHSENRWPGAHRRGLTVWKGDGIPADDVMHAGRTSCMLGGRHAKLCFSAALRFWRRLLRLGFGVCWYRGEWRMDPALGWLDGMV